MVVPVVREDEVDVFWLVHDWTVLLVVGVGLGKVYEGEYEGARGRWVYMVTRRPKSGVLMFWLGWRGTRSGEGENTPR